MPWPCSYASAAADIVDKREEKKTKTRHVRDLHYRDFGIADPIVTCLALQYPIHSRAWLAIRGAQCHAWLHVLVNDAWHVYSVDPMLVLLQVCI